VLTEKNIKNARVILLFCHASENTVFCLIIYIAVIVENQQATMTNGSKHRKKLLKVFYFSRINKKLLKMRE